MAVLVHSPQSSDRAGDVVLTWADVRAIRGWALANGHLSEASCVRVLQQRYPAWASTLRAIVANTSDGWFDEGYRPLRRPPDVTRVASPANNITHRRVQQQQLQLIYESKRMNALMQVLSKIAVGLMLLFLAAPVSAQTAHPCDATPAAVEARPGVSFALGFCNNLKDKEGNTLTVEGFKVTMDGTLLTISGTLTKSATANAAGLWYFETPKTLTAAEGNHTLTVVLVGKGGDGEPSAPFPLVSRALPPGQPSGLRLVK